LTGSASTTHSPYSGSRTQFRDASGRSTGTQTSSGNCYGSTTTTHRDPSNRVTGTTSTPSICNGFPLVPVPPIWTKK
jgi:hypothetical protein